MELSSKRISTFKSNNKREKFDVEDNKNLKLYYKYATPPDNALKSFDNGNFKGTDINTMWRIKCLTEEFGECGFGWTIEINRLWSEEVVAVTRDGAGNTEKLSFANITLFVCRDGVWSRGISANGGSKILKYNNSKGYSSSSDEGYKMAITDALGVACKLLGFGSKIYWTSDRTKYTDSGVSENTLEKKNKPEHELNLAEARAMTTSKGTPLFKLDAEHLKFIIDNSKQQQLVKAAELVLDDLLAENEDIIPDEQDILPWD